MSKLSILKFNVDYKDRATGLIGRIAMWTVDMGHRLDYVWQPKVLNKETGHPIDRFYFPAERLETVPDNFHEVEVPLEILGKQVTDDNTGFTGMAIALVQHVNGCFHVVIQPSQILENTGAPVARREVDLRQCSGEGIPKWDAVALAQSKVERPSPDGEIPASYMPEIQGVPMH